MEAKTTTSKEPVRNLANFPPSIWGDRFLYFSVDNLELEAYAQAMEEPKEEVRRLIINQTMDSNAKLGLIYCVYRLGLKYLFSEEIDGQLDKLFKELNFNNWDEADLYTTSVNFQVFRHFGYKLSCDVFNKFKDHRSGKFKEYINNDVRGMLSFYECAHLGTNREYILDEALAFTKAQLEKIVNSLEGNLAQQVKHALERPFNRGMPMMEARLYFSNYIEDCSSYDSLRRLANAHFKYLQLLQKKELSIVSKWWKDMDFKTITPYVRDRVPELYLWILALFFEPQYSQARIITTKIIILVLVLDDTCDAYATIDEIRLLTHAISRWESIAMEQLPEYIKPFYKILLDEYVEFEKQCGKANIVNASKQAFQEQAKGYLIEEEWTHTGEVPSFEEYIKNGLTTSTHNILSKSSLIGMGEIVTKEALAWHQSHPKILKASELISRLHDDVMTFQFERERRQSITGVDAYVKTFGVSENVAVDELMKMIENAWKDMNEECLQPREFSMDVIAPILNLARMIDVAYKHNDGFTFPEKTLKEYITLLLVDPPPMY